MQETSKALTEALMHIFLLRKDRFQQLFWSISCFPNPKIITKYVEVMQYAMEVDTIEWCRPKLVGGNIPSTSDTSST